MKLPYDHLEKAITEQAKISPSELATKITAKMDALAGLISKEGAAHIIANELGVKLFEEDASVALAIKDLRDGQRGVSVTGKVLAAYEPKTFTRKDGGEGKIASALLQDGTGVIRIVAWNEQATELALERGQAYTLTDLRVRENQRGYEAHLGEESTIEKSDADIPDAPTAQRTTLEKLESGTTAEVLATIVAAYEPRFYEICPDCGKRARPKDGKPHCARHGDVTPSYGAVMNCVLDDGTDTVRGVFFNAQLSRLLGTDDLEPYRSEPGRFADAKDQLLGTMIKLTGRVSKNEMFDRIELVAQQVETNPDPTAELS